MKHNNFNSLLPFINNVGSFIDEVLHKGVQDFNGGQIFQVNNPAVNVIDLPDHVELHVAAPGLKKSDFQINVENRKLIISAEFKNENEEKTDQFTRKEFDYRSFKRTYTLNDNLDENKISAKYENGILNISVPKLTKEESSPKSIVIE